ncbi:hypothetical protein [Rhizobium alvei]|uniref:Uncharacterized protein n=1 Tax=Rhizobium alvei TaxID=1132659 RepID=A0ABT8YUF4_9HYPH|nr:hypothetical protein [Rhizobium alvei]MDO6967100.1 hypothetical protein [Rhizobium alvei]
MTPIRAEAIFCDDIRWEANGKQILIGVYPNDLVPAQIPIQIPISLWIRIHGLDDTRKHFVAEVRDGGQEPLIAVNVEIDKVPDSEAVVIALPQLPLEIRSPQPIVVSLLFEGLPPIEAGRLKITPKWETGKH